LYALRQMGAVIAIGKNAALRNVEMESTREGSYLAYSVGLAQAKSRSEIPPAETSLVCRSV